MIKNTKKIIKLIIFICIAAVLFIKVSGVLKMETTVTNVPNYNTFYELTENSIDGIVLGNSVIDRGFNAPYAFNESGIAVYSLASESQPLAMTNYLIEEAMKTQNPEFIMIDIHSLRSTTFYYASEVFIRRITDAMPFSKTRWQCVTAGMDYYNNVSEYRKTHEKNGLEALDKLSMYFPFVKYHTRWGEVAEDDYETVYSEVMSAFTDEGKTFKVSSQTKPELTSNKGGLTDYQKQILTEIIEYCDENKINVVFLSVPSCLEEYEQEELNEAFEIIENYESDYLYTLNMNDYEIYDLIGIDWKNDFYNADHVNSRGALKITEYLQEYLRQTFNLTDKRQNNEYGDWHTAYENYMKFYEAGWNSK